MEPAPIESKEKVNHQYVDYQFDKADKDMLNKSIDMDDDMYDQEAKTVTADEAIVIKESAEETV